MTVLGLAPAELARLAASVMPGRDPGGDGVDDGRSAARFARAALTTLVEPGDSDAGALVNILGPVVSLQAITEQWTVDRILGAIGDVDASEADALDGRIESALERWRPRTSLRAAVRAIEAAARLGATLVAPEDALWPHGLHDLFHGAPLALWVRGEAARLRSLDRSVALVGARAATGYGEHVAMESTAGLCDLGLATVSGGAYGIDGAVHRATLASGKPTIAFIAGGVDRLYPAGHADLLTRIAARGLLIGELPCGSSPTKWRFLQRNRLIAAASRATVVVEAGRRSGSLNTAGHAAMIGRPLGAVPGPVTSPASVGCHRLIREYGAICVTGAGDIAELAGLAAQEATETGSDDAARGRSPEETRLLDALSSRSMRSVEELAVRSGMSTRDVIATLGHLEIDGRVDERASGWIRRP